MNIRKLFKFKIFLPSRAMSEKVYIMSYLLSKKIISFIK